MCRVGTVVTSFLVKESKYKEYIEGLVVPSMVDIGKI